MKNTQSVIESAVKSLSTVDNRRKIDTTTEYSRFHLVTGNRPIHRRRVDRLREAIKKNNLCELYPIICRADFGIVDGQHRFLACVAEKLPVYYVVTGDMELKDVPSVNSLQTPWIPKDYLRMYQELEIHSYKVFAGYLSRWSFTVTTGLMMFYGVRSNKIHEDFKAGKFDHTQIGIAESRAEALCELSRYVPFCREYSFALAFIRVQNHPDYSHKRMLRKLQIATNMVHKCTNYRDYMRMLEDIYNYRAGKKIRF